jgi:RHS repeat-associated protein
MGKPGAKKMDQIVSVTPGDVHIIMIPSPGGPVPTPIPHPCASMIKDKVATKVKVMGQPGAVKGSKSKHTPPHIPMGPGPFQKPPKNEGEIITGSSSVFYEGKEAAMLGDTGQMCSDPSDTPVGKVIGTAAMVLVGGGSSGGDAERAQASANAMKAAAAACHKWINANMPPGPEREQAHRNLCTATGHPIDVATGKLMTRSIDLELPGRIPFKFIRNYSSCRPEPGPCGWGWRHSYQLELIIGPDFVAHRDANGRFLSFPSVKEGESSTNLAGGLVLRRTADAYWVEDASGLAQKFNATTDGPSALPVNAIEDAFGNRIRFSYENGRLADIFDSAERQVRLEYDERGRMRRLLIKNPATLHFDLVRSLNFDEADDLVEVVDGLNQSLHYEYANHFLVRETDRNRFSFYFRYDTEGWCRETWGDGGLFYRRIDYDRARRCTRVWNSEGHPTLYAWNELGLVEVETDALGNKWSFQYDEHQHKISAEDPLGNAWLYEYDESGRLLSRTDPAGNTVAIEYDKLGRRTGYVDGQGRMWPLRYDASGQLASLVDPDSNSVSMEWSERGDLIASVDELGRRTTFKFDSAGNLLERIGTNGLVVERGYTPRGQLLHETDSLGPRVEFQYDALGRVTVERWRGRGQTTYEYDPEGNVIKLTDALGVATTFEYGRFNKLLRRITPAAGTGSSETRLEYDLENRLCARVYPGGRRAEYGYDEDGRISWKRSVDGRKIRYMRNAAGFVTEAYDDAGLLATYEHDGLGRIIKRRTADGEESIFAYDASGQLVSAANDAGEVTMEYDAFGRVVAENGPHGGLKNEFDVGGRQIKSSFGEKLSCTMVWEDGRIQFHNDAGSVSADYDAYGRLTGLGFSNGKKEKYAYDRLQRPSAIFRGSEEIQHSYDPAGCLIEVKTSGGTKKKFQRDNQRRLVSAVRNGTGPARRYQFHYDLQGNRSRDGLGFRFGNGNRLLATSDEVLKYDGHGRIVERTSRDGISTKYRYSSEGRLMEARRGNDVTTFRYDALARRVSKTFNGRETRYAWDGTRLAYEWRPDGEERHYMYRPESHAPMMLQRRTNGGDWEAFFFHNDHRGCPESVTDGQGQEVWRADVGAFGEIYDEEGSFDQPLALPGQYRDRETGLVYNYHRYFDPQLTIFLTPDPIGHLGGDQLYAFTADPITKGDLLGLGPDDYDQTKKTPHRIVEINGVKYVEFEASQAFTSGGNINVGGSGVGPDGSPDAMASIGPNGEVVVMEGRHRAVAAAGGDAIPESLGGIPGKPGHLRYPLGENGSYETTQNVGPSLSSLANDPAKLDAARSGHPSRRTT